MFAYGGKILRINLSKGKITTENLSEDLIKNYVGGRGFAARLLYDELKPGVDPLSPDNKLLIASGPLSGLFIPGAGKTTFASKSPATGSYGDSNVGGMLAPEIKYAGYDVIILEGRAAQPSYIYIENDKVEIRDAKKYWGQGAITTEKMLKEDLGEQFQIATIGPAGEKLVKFACISHDFGRQAGRTGVGTVMGSKNIKAVAIRGTRSLKMKDPKLLKKLSSDIIALGQKHPNTKVFIEQGTASVTNWSNEQGAFPTR
ncbi:MAG: aldehyde ferredoxin oxidoreductase, partial [Planctomycetes bacterium]|nr:aldehyde ferredoxin oxidoreductase [Planctomycetota bacterium]